MTAADVAAFANVANESEAATVKTKKKKKTKKKLCNTVALHGTVRLQVGTKVVPTPHFGNPNFRGGGYGRY
jgi:hypothetical protein